ncbi:fumarylacetoacetate hydrolase family protein [Marivita sp.]|uniref:fumarylacetoacetate hydrolase family protein n=1 Tax=Marivita sp. TaxID=2003365 RepID=UPI003F723BCE
MKVATRPIPGKSHRHDGELVVVSDDLRSCRRVRDLTLQDVLDSDVTEDDLRPHLAKQEDFVPASAHAPLPRAYQFLDGSAYVNHVELVRKARGAQMPDSFWSDPLMYQGLSVFAAPCAPILGKEDWGIDFEAEVAVITRHVPLGVTAEDAAGYIAYVMLLNDVSLRNLIPPELSKGFGFVHSKPISACSPVAVTPDVLPGWDGRKLHGTLRVDLNGTPFGRADAGIDMTFDFGDLIAHAAKTRALPAGSVIGSGTISNKLDNGPGKTVAEGGAGYSCIAEQRMVETILHGGPRTPFMAAGDHVEIWMEDQSGQDIFGHISQTVETI